MSSSNVEAAVLWWCRRYSDKRHHYVMRVGHDGKCRILDMFETEPKPGGYDWETRHRVHAEGDTWEDVARLLTTTKTRENMDSLAKALPRAAS